MTVSKGPGHVEQRILQIFAKQPKGLFTTRELCRRVFKTGRIEKKHRVSALRALKSLSRRSDLNIWRLAWKGQRDDRWFNYDKLWPQPRYRKYVNSGGAGGRESPDAGEAVGLRERGPKGPLAFAAGSPSAKNQWPSA
jgi:hypothetical protein